MAVALAYPLSDVVVLTMAAVVLVRSGSGDRLPLTLVTVGVACIALSDSLFAYLTAQSAYDSGGTLDIGWVAGLLFIAGGAVASRRAGREIPAVLELPSWASIWLPYVPLLVAGITAAANPRELLRYPIVQVVAGLLVVAVLARQYLAVSENRRLVTAVAEQALRDPLTGLANRARFTERLNHAMEKHEREGVSVGVISMDLNDFKLVNDNLGHHVGDELLSGVASRLLNSVRSGDTVARPGGDEFCLIVSGSAEAAHLVADRVVQAFDEPFMVAGHQLPMRPSVGLAIAEPGEPVRAAELLERADTAMYAAKRSGNRGVQVYDPQMTLAAADSDEMFGQTSTTPEAGGLAAIELLGDFRQAIANSELALVYQPKFDLLTSRIVGVEALLRWNRPDGQVVTPKDFLPLVHRHGLTGAVTDFVLNRALDDALTWRAASFDVPVAVNLFAAVADQPRHPRQDHPGGDRAGPAAVHPDRRDHRGHVPGQQGAHPQLFWRHCGTTVFGSPSTNSPAVTRLCRTCANCRSTRSSSTSTSSHRYSPTPVRRAWCAPSCNWPTDSGLTTVAEGIENAETANWLRDQGCRIGQGYFLCPPVPSAELLALLSNSAVATTGQLESMP